MASIQRNIEDKNKNSMVIRAYTEQEALMIDQWLKTNKPKKVGLNMSIYDYSMIVDKKQSKLGADNRSRSSES